MKILFGLVALILWFAFIVAQSYNYVVVTTFNDEYCKDPAGSKVYAIGCLPTGNGQTLDVYCFSGDGQLWGAVEGCQGKNCTPCFIHNSGISGACTNGMLTFCTIIQLAVFIAFTYSRSAQICKFENVWEPERSCCVRAFIPILATNAHSRKCYAMCESAKSLFEMPRKRFSHLSRSQI
eukprot:Phypoly_transcript_20873.p1 GENE.Phypoly_transcript_20873~~Phypoly_transcript_20873.p1  ORF type:complete len:179 (+),score=2.08 Phypoly_transcript_20873:100-636(+)